MSDGLTLRLDADALDAIAERAAAIVLGRLREERNDGASWPEWMSVETAARYLDASPERVRKLAARGELPFSQEAPGCRVFFRRSELDEAMARRGGI